MFTAKGVHFWTSPVRKRQHYLVTLLELSKDIHSKEELNFNSRLRDTSKSYKKCTCTEKGKPSRHIESLI